MRHQGGMIVAVDAGEFESELIASGELSPPGLVAAEERILARADDEFVARVIAAAGKDRRLLGGKDAAFIGSGAGLVDRCLERQIGELSGLAHIGLLGYLRAGFWSII
jgi:hypothetical protein